MMMVMVVIIKNSTNMLRRPGHSETTKICYNNSSTFTSCWSNPFSKAERKARQLTCRSVTVRDWLPEGQQKPAIFLYQGRIQGRSNGWILTPLFLSPLLSNFFSYPSNIEIIFDFSWFLWLRWRMCISDDWFYQSIYSFWATNTLFSM